MYHWGYMYFEFSGLELVAVFQLIGIFNGKYLMFYHSLNIILGFYVILLRYVFKLMGYSPNGGPKMHQFFEFL